MLHVRNGRWLLPSGSQHLRGFENGRHRANEAGHSAAAIDAIDPSPSEQDKAGIDTQIIYFPDAISIDFRISAQIDQPIILHDRLPAHWIVRSEYSGGEKSATLVLALVLTLRHFGIFSRAVNSGNNNQPKWISTDRYGLALLQERVNHVTE